MFANPILRLLVFGLTGAACLPATAWPAPAVAVTASPPGLPAPRAATAASPHSLPAVFFGDHLILRKAVAMGVFSSATGRLEKIIAPPKPFGGVSQLALAPGGKTIAWVQGNGTCGSLIESAATTGGRIKVVVPDKPQHGGTPAFGPSYSPDGRYFSYGTMHCDNGATFLHLRDLSTGRTRTYRTSAGIFGLTFIDNDRRALYMNGFQLDVASLPALTSRVIRPPAGCRYYHVTGTETKLVVALVCGKRHHASLITLSTTTFRPTGAPIKLGKCTLPTSLSIAPSDPAALLVEDILGCHTSPTKDPKAALLEIRGVAVHQILSGKFAFLPGNSVW
jgi:hypothetical protein